MPYQLDFGKIIREGNRREQKKWEELNEYCRKNQKKQEDLFRQAFEDIKRRNKEKLAMIEDPRTSDWRRASLILEHILTTI